MLLATSYSLGQDFSEDFSSPEDVYAGPDTTITFTDISPGVYYYSVYAVTPYGNTYASDFRVVKVGGIGTITINIPWPEE